jgi:hypothetical protein
MSSKVSLSASSIGCNANSMSMRGEELIAMIGSMPVRLNFVLELTECLRLWSGHSWKEGKKGCLLEGSSILDEVNLATYPILPQIYPLMICMTHVKGPSQLGLTE